jgi:hypothetical protein
MTKMWQRAGRSQALPKPPISNSAAAYIIAADPEPTVTDGVRISGYSKFCPSLRLHMPSLRQPQR